MFDDGVRYEKKTVKALRGTEARSIAKWQKEGWELVDRSAGTLQTTLDFRRPKPPLPVRQMVIGGAVALLLAGIIGAGVLLEGDGDGTDVQAAGSTPVATEPSRTLPTPVATEQPDTPPTPVATEQPDTPPTPVASQQPDRPPAPTTDITVDGLFDTLNSADMGGVENGDRFRLTAELSGAEYWGTGASGEFFVYLKAKGGANDLLVFVDESDAAGWKDGTWVEMVVEAGETTINGETTDGWLRARSVSVTGS